MIVVTGVSGQLGSAFRRRLGDRARYLDEGGLDLTNVAAPPDHSPRHDA